MPNKLLDLTGKEYARLRVLRRSDRDDLPRGVYWECLCICGKHVAVRSARLRTGKTKSCGCWRQDAARTHGMSKTRLYKSWASMLARCTNPKVRSYPNYGGRGIAVIDSWKDFNNFFADMGAPPKVGMQLDRVDNDKGYFKENCQWVTVSQNCRNKRTNRLVEFKGQMKTLAEISEITGINSGTLYSRASVGWEDIAQPLVSDRLKMHDRMAAAITEFIETCSDIQSASLAELVAIYKDLNT